MPRIRACIPRHVACRSFPWMRAWLGVFLLTAFSSACIGPATPCDGVGGRKSVVTPQEYAPCAQAMIARLDALRPPMDAFMRGEPGARAAAVERHRDLALLLRRSGLQREFDSILYAPGGVTERWPDHRMLSFNSELWWAAFYYRTVIESPAGAQYDSYREEYYDKASTSHDHARSAYDEVW